MPAECALQFEDSGQWRSDSRLFDALLLTRVNSELPADSNQDDMAPSGARKPGRAQRAGCVNVSPLAPTQSTAPINRIWLSPCSASRLSTDSE